MKKVTLRAMESMIIVSWSYVMNPGSFVIPLKLYKRTPLLYSDRNI